MPTIPPLMARTPMVYWVAAAVKGAPAAVGVIVPADDWACSSKNAALTVAPGVDWFVNVYTVLAEPLHVPKTSG